MPVNAQFQWTRPLVANLHAILEIRLIGASGRASSKFGALVDTGATYSAISLLIATNVGYTVTNLPTTSVKIATGNTVSFPYIQNALVEIEGHRVTAKRLLVNQTPAIELLAPEDLLNATEFAADAKEIHFD